MMARKVLISLVSEQTLPNLELIKEFNEFIDQYIFVHSSQTVNETNWLLNASGIKDPVLLEVNAFDIADIELKLRNFNFPDDEYYLNITGGTKIMILVFQEFFKNLGAKIFYVTGQNREYLKVFPVIGERKFQLSTKVTLDEYLSVYGFGITKNSPLKNMEDSEKLMDFFLCHDMREFIEPIERIREKRGKPIRYEQDEIINKYLDTIGFCPAEPGRLSKSETKYLTGDWFEEYVYFKIKAELNLDDTEIGTGYNLIKKGTPNELDVLFIYHHKLYIIECKTDVIELRTLPDGSKKEFKLLPEIIYKSDALRSKFGLFANTSIFTLGEIKSEDGKPLKGYETSFDRAELSRIKLISKRDFKSGESIKNLLKII